MAQFADLDLQPGILKALEEMGYQTLTPIQEQTFEPIVAGQDVLALAETGSGKTSACAIPLLQRLDASDNCIQALILVPTRELALQYVNEISRVAQHTDYAPFAVFGGMDMEIQKAKLIHGVHVLVATPGRLIDLLRNSDDLSLRHIRTVVLDEADEMLKMGFVDDVTFILSCIIQEHQTLLFSATMPPRIKGLVEQFLKEPVTIELIQSKALPSSIRHDMLHSHPRDRLSFLLDYIEQEKITQAILFANSRIRGEKLLNDLKGKLQKLDFIHGGVEQARRTSIYNRFKRQEIRFMVATDIASRGLDFSHVTHVINFDFPRSPELYTHRTGRTGRMGREGTAFSFVGNADLPTLAEVVRRTGLEPIWLGEAPELKRKKKRGGRPGRGRDGKRRPRNKVKKPASDKSG